MERKITFKVTFIENLLKKSVAKCLLFFVLFFGAQGVFSQVSGDYRSNGLGTAWESAASWEKYNGTAWAASADYPGQNSGAGNVMIRFGGSITLGVSPANAIGSLSVGDGTGNGSGISNTGATLSISTFTLVVTGNIIVSSANGSRNGVLNNGSGTVKTGGTFSISGGTYTPGTGSFEYNSASNQNIFNTTYYNLLTSNGGSKTTIGTTTVSNNLTIGDGTTFTVAGFALTVTGTTTVGAGTSGVLTISSATGAKAFNGNVTVNTGGTWNNTAANVALTFPGSISNSGIFNAGTGVYTLSGTTKTITGTFSIPSVAVTGTYTNNGTLTVATALAGTGGLTQGATGVLNIGGTSTITTLTATATGNTVNYNGAAQTVKVTPYYNLTLSGSGAKTIGTAASGTLATGALTISGSATASVTNTNISVAKLTLGGYGKINGTWGSFASVATNKDATYFTTGITGYVNVTTDTRPILTVTASAQSKIYGTTAPTSGTLNTNFTVTGLLFSDVANGATLSYNGSPAGNLATASVGSYVITPSALTLSTGSISNYNIAYTNGTLTVNTANLTISGLTGNNKVYNGLTTATSSGTATYSGLKNGESFTVTGTPTLNFSDANVGNGKTITVTGYTAPSLNYTVTQPSLTGDITVAGLTIIGLTGNNKVYDGLTTATSSGTAMYSGLQNGETFAVSGTPVLNFSDKNVGIGKTITVIGCAAPSPNYIVTQPSLTADITPALLTITADNVTKCEGTTYTLGTTAFTSTGLISGESIDSVTLSSLGASSSATHGTYAITPSAAVFAETFLISNYSIVYNDGTMTVNPLPTASITVNGELLCKGSTAVFTVTGTSGATIVYNVNGGANTTATLTGGTFDISLPGVTTSQTVNLVSVSDICTASLSVSSTINVGESTTWNGTGWNNGVPTSTKEVIFNGNYVIDADFDACSITVNSGDVSVLSGNNVSLNGAIKVIGGSFTLNNIANLYQADASVVNTGNIVVKRDTNALMRLDYTLWGCPVSGQKLSAFSPLTSVSPTVRFYTYTTATNTYDSVESPSTINFETGKGYLIRVPNNHPTDVPTVWQGSFKGVPNNGTKTITLQSIEAGKRYNAVGNPYPSPIRISTFAADNASNIESTLYFWRKTNGSTGPSYCTWNTETGTFGDNGQSSAVDPNDILQKGQGFIVEAKEGATSLVFNNGQRVVDNQDQFFKLSNAVSAKNPKEAHRIWLNLKGTTGFSQVVVGYFTNGTVGVDKTDSKFFNDGPVALKMKINNDNYIIQGRPVPFDSSDVVPLSYNVTTAGTYTFAIDHVDGIFSESSQDIYIKDKLDNTYHQLNGSSYVFTTDTGSFDDRFELVFKTTSTLSVNQNDFSANNIVVYHQMNDVIINTGIATMETVKIFDISGRLLVAKKNINLSEVKINTGTTNQVLLVEVTTKEGLKATKKVIN